MTRKKLVQDRPKCLSDFRDMLDRARAAARKVGLTKKDIAEAIRLVREQDK